MDVGFMDGKEGIHRVVGKFVDFVVGSNYNNKLKLEKRMHVRERNNTHQLYRYKSR